MASKYQEQHYEDVAQLVRDSMHQTLDGYPFNWAERFADLFAADNPLFDRERFLKACGLEGA